MMGGSTKISGKKKDRTATEGRDYGEKKRTVNLISETKRVLGGVGGARGKWSRSDIGDYSENQEKRLSSIKKKKRGGIED